MSTEVICSKDTKLKMAKAASLLIVENKIFLFIYFLLIVALEN